MKNIIIPTISLLSLPLSASIVVDNFDSGTFNDLQTGVGSSTFTQTGIATSDTIGGIRSVKSDVITGTGSSRVNTDQTAGQFTWNVDSATSGLAHLYYGSSATGGSHLNADFSAESAIQFDVISTDVPGTMRIELVMNGGASIWEVDVAVPGLIVTPISAAVDFSSFTHVSGGAMDLSDVDAMTFEVTNALASSDWQFDAITVVPEPSTGALLGLAGLLLILRRRT